MAVAPAVGAAPPAAGDPAAAPAAGDSAAAAPPVTSGTTSAAGDSITWSPLAAPAVRDSTLRQVKPFLVMARSAIVPGWGQVYNRQPLKAVVVVAGEGFLTYKIFQELKRENEAIDRQNAATDDAELEAAQADELDHYNRKVNWIWWTAAAHLLQMADAYVDAHLINFDAEFGPDDRPGSRGAPRLRLSLNARF